MKTSNIGTTYNNNFYISIIKDEIQSLEKQIEEIDKTLDMIRFEKFRTGRRDDKQYKKEVIKLHEKKRVIRKRIDKCLFDLDLIQNHGSENIGMASRYVRKNKR